MERAYKGSIELLITDIAMPRMSGLALRRAFAEDRPGTPVLFISGNPGTTLVGEPFLAKPFTPAELMSKVKELLASRHIPAGAVSEVSPDHQRA
jgi:DNA-binding response OmpR family regulator